MRANEFIAETTLTTETIMVDGIRRPTTNSKGQPIYPTQDGIIKFWKWFGDSKVVDRQGRPMVVYHGTVSNFSEFKPRNEPNRSNAIWFTPSPEYASEAATSWRGANGNVMPCYVKLQNPLVVEFSFASAFRPEREQDIRNAGHDGVIGTKFGNLSDNPNTWQVVVFDSSRVKSASGNKGLFKATSPDISESHSNVSEASYDGNIGFIELVKFNQVASPEQKQQLQSLVKEKKVNAAWDLLQKVTGVVLKPFNSAIAESVLMELANAPYEILLIQNRGRNAFRYWFTTDKGDEFAVDIGSADQYIIEVGFAKRTNDKNQFNVKMTGESGSETFRIFSTVVHCINETLKKIPSAQEIIFSGDSSDPSRISLYRKFARNAPRFLPGWNLEAEIEPNDASGLITFVLSRNKNEKTQ